MRILIAEDDFASRKFMLKFLSKYGECDVAVDGIEAVDAYLNAINNREEYDLVCLDIMMPEMDGYQTLKAMRDIEIEQDVPDEKCAKVIMTTALDDSVHVSKAFEYGCVAYATKPVDIVQFESVMRKLQLI